MADKEAVDFLEQNGLEQLISPLRKAKIRRQDFAYFKEHIVELQTVIPSLRNRIDFIQSLRNSKTEKACQADLAETICSHEVRKK